MTTSRFLDDPRFVRKYDSRVAAELGDKAATLIQQVHYHVVYRLQRWNSDEWRSSLSEWQREFPFWSMDTIRRVIKFCKKIGVLNVRKGVFQGRKAFYYSLNYEILEQVGAAGEQKVQIAPIEEPNEVCKKHTLQGAKSTLYTVQNEQHLLIPSTSTKTTTNKRGVAIAPQDPISQDRLKEIRENNRKKVVESFARRATAQSFAKLWELLVVQTYTRAGYIPLTPIDKRNVKEHFLKWCGEAGVDPQEFVSWCVDNWPAIASTAELKWAKLGEYPSFYKLYGLKDRFLEVMRAKGGASLVNRSEPEVYTDLASVPKDHPRYRQIELLIARTGKAVLR